MCVWLCHNMNLETVFIVMTYWQITDKRRWTFVLQIAFTLVITNHHFGIKVLYYAWMFILKSGELRVNFITFLSPNINHYYQKIKQSWILMIFCLKDYFPWSVVLSFTRFRLGRLKGKLMERDRNIVLSC